MDLDNIALNEEASILRDVCNAECGCVFIMTRMMRWLYYVV